MSSSVREGAGPHSPAPPAVSPLTDPAPDPGNREPSVNVSLDQETSNNQREPSPTAARGPTEKDDYFSHNQHNVEGGSSNAPEYDIFANTAATMELYQQHQMQMVMALAQLRAPQMALPQNSTIRPDQVSLSMSMLETGAHPVQENGHSNGTAPADPPPLESFARIEFADSTFQMTTYAVIIGRDRRALRQAKRDEMRAEEYRRRCEEAAAQGLPLPSPPCQDRKFSKSYVSEEGGMLGPESEDDEGDARPAKRRKTSPNQEVAAKEEAAQDDMNLIVNRQYVSNTPGAASVNLTALQPNPHYVPFIGIHSPGPNIAARTKGISREHLKIQFNPEKGVFEAIPLHKNGFFCEDVHYSTEKVILKSGDRLQIKDVEFLFLINGVPAGKTGAEEYFDEDEASNRRYSEGGKEMSFEFESSRDAGRRTSSSEEEQADAAKNEDESQSDLSEPPDEDMEQDDEDDEDDNEVMETIERDAEDRHVKSESAQPQMSGYSELSDLAGLPPFPPKKRGPGRPPKNGIMSKREERLRKKAAMELARQNMPPPPVGEPPMKRKVGRPRKHPLPENADDRPEKRKYKPRRPKDGPEGEGSDPERTFKEKRREKPKTPPLELRREDYTEEQLQKPNKNYGVLIDEVLTAAPDGLTLKQIYKRIQMKYPFYYFTVDTKGWESSVRHNLIGNDAFKKNEETHLWSRVPGIDIDAGKKRKATSPENTASLHGYGQHYGGASHVATPQHHSAMFHGEYVPQQGYHAHHPSASENPPGFGQYNSNGGPRPPQQQPAANIPQQQVGVPGQQQAPPRPAYPNPGQAAHQPAQIPPQAGYAAQPSAARPALPVGAQSATSYSSPYASKPVAPGMIKAASGATPHSMARQLPHQPVNGHVSAQVNGVPQAHNTTPSAYQPAAAAPAGGSPAPPLKPAVAPELVRHVTNFKKTVTEQLEKRSKASEAIAMSVINRGLGLTSQSMVPDDEALEKIVLGVFETSRKNLGVNQSLHPGLVSALVNFKNSMIKTLESKLGPLESERLVLSAVDRVLGFADHSTTQGSEAEKREYDNAETVLIPAIKNVVLGHQKAIAAGSTTTLPASTPAPPPAAAPIPKAAPAPMPAAPMATPMTAPTPTPTPMSVSVPAAAAPTAAARMTTPVTAAAPPTAPMAATAPAPAPAPAPVLAPPAAPSMAAPAPVSTPAAAVAPMAAPAPVPTSAPMPAAPMAAAPITTTPAHAPA
ncbi:hypothetical protein QBC46DRAFT_276746, partial [Diplogelasinospora grovesii]